VADARAGGAPTVLRVVLGKRLQELRERARLSFEQAAAALDVTHATVRRMEKAEVGLKLPYVEKLLRTYGVTDSTEIEGFLRLAREANKPGWWHSFRDVVPEWFNTFVSLEGAANLIRGYEPHYVPGVLQTEDYARAVLRAGQPHASDREIERRIALRMERQAVLRRPEPPMLWVVLDETVLRRPIGGPVTMRAQLTRLIEAVESPFVRLQVMPYEAGPHSAMYGPFHIFRFPIPELPDIAYTETLVSGSYYDQRSDVSAFLEALDRMCAQAAPAQATQGLLRGIRKES
jgi:transcriptional regulator with XRE-family HTH domain